MEDTAILDLYWARDERAITETQKSYGKYCYSIAYHILHDREDTEECLNDTWTVSYTHLTLPTSDLV